MYKPAIENLEEQIKTRFYDYLKKNNKDDGKLSEVACNELITKTIDWLVYKSDLSKIICSFIKIANDCYFKIEDYSDLDYSNIDFIEITIYLSGVEPEFNSILQASAIINIPYNELNSNNMFQLKNIQVLQCRIGDEYLEQLMDKYIPKGLYKQSRLFRNTQPIVIDEDRVRFTQYLREEFNQECAVIGFRENDVSDMFKSYVTEFINNEAQLILQINDNKFLDEYKDFLDLETNISEICKGIRLYKLPTIDYTEEYALIETICSSLQVKGEFYEEYMTGCTAIEVSPDRYLEFYATRFGHENLFKEILNAGGVSDVFVLTSAYMGILFPFYLMNKKFGAEENVLISHLRSYVIYD